MRSGEPPAGYLDGVRAFASRYEVILIFDEVSSGFRIARGSAQEYAGVTPDISVFAKAISNGYPMGAVVGKREFMEPAAQMFISSAYWDDNIGIAASLATLRELERRDAVAHFNRIGALFKEQINAAAVAVGLDAACEGVAAHPHIRFGVDDAEVAAKVNALFIQENARRGVILAAGFMFNCAHGEEEVEQTAAVVEESFAMIAEGLDRGTLDQLLEVPPQAELFRRLVH